MTRQILLDGCCRDVRSAVVHRGRARAEPAADLIFASDLAGQLRAE